MSNTAAEDGSKNHWGAGEGGRGRGPGERGKRRGREGGRKRGGRGAGRGEEAVQGHQACSCLTQNTLNATVAWLTWTNVLSFGKVFV